MKNKTQLFCILILTMACGRKSSSLDFKVNERLSEDTVVTFSTIKQDVLSPHCISCHNDVSTESGLLNWITPGDPETSAFFTSVENGSMPKNGSPLDSRSLELIRLYITHLVPTGGSTTGSTTGGGTPSGITYAEIKSAVLVPSRCVNCHSVGTEAKLSKWINTANPSKSSFYTTIKNGSMPQGGPHVSASATALVLQYVKDFSNR